MKSLLIIACTICVLMVSCKKEQQHPGKTNQSAVKKYAVKFTGSVFDQYTTGIGVARPTGLFSAMATNAVSDTASLQSAGINKYYFIVYDANGNEVDRISKFITVNGGPINQNRYFADGLREGDPGFPTPYVTTIPGPFEMIADSLAAGTYTVIILAAAVDFNAVQDFYINTQSDSSFPGPGGYFYLPLSTAYFNFTWFLDPIVSSADTYMYKGTITVTTHDIQQNYTLNRIVGQLVINIEDAMPANAAGIDVGLSEEYMGLSLNDLQPNQLIYLNTLGLPVSSDELGKTNTQFTHFIINTVTPMDVSITCYDASNNTIATKTINGVQFTKNEKTILTGKLFDGVQTTGVKINPSLASRSAVVHF